MASLFFIVPYLITIFLCLVVGFVATLVGNVVVLIVMLKDSVLRDQNMIALALVDLLSGVIFIPFAIYKKAANSNCTISSSTNSSKENNETNYTYSYTPEQKSCMLLLSIILILFGIQMSLQVILTIERYKVISDPLGYTRTHKKIKIVFCIVFGIIIGILPLVLPYFGFDKGFEPCGYFSVALSPGYLLLFSCLDFIAIGLITFLYWKMRKTLLNSSRQWNDQPGRKKADNRTNQTLCLAAGFIMFSWIPIGANFFLVWLTGEALVSKGTKEEYAVAFSLTGFIMAFLSSAINPIIHGFRGKEFCRAFQKEFQWLGFKEVESQLESSPRNLKSETEERSVTERDFIKMSFLST